MVEKEAVPVERVRLAKESIPGEETVCGEVRKERIETEGDAAWMLNPPRWKAGHGWRGAAVSGGSPWRRAGAGPWRSSRRLALERHAAG